jgi:hydroxymethylglutaryl-CoA lyase
MVSHLFDPSEGLRTGRGARNPRMRIRDVTARDGLQAERPVEPADRVELVRRLFAAGLRDVEVASFVSPKAVPAMAGGADVVAAVLPDVPDGATAWALVPNVKGAELATAAGVDHLTITVSASPAYSEKNVHMTLDESRIQVEAIRGTAPDAVLDEVISCAFGSPFPGEEITPDDVAVFVDHARAVGVDQVTLADTTGVGTPRRVGAVLDRVGTDVGLHLHDTRGTALLNAWTAIDRGVARFDTAVGGLGGSPFAPAAGGNLATEDLVNVLNDARFDTGVDLDALLAIGPMLADLVGHALPSRVAAADGPR